MRGIPEVGRWRSIVPERLIALDAGAPDAVKPGNEWRRRTMKLGRASILGLMAILGLTPPGGAQVPPTAAPPAGVSPFAAGPAAPAAASPAAAAAAAPPQATLWGFLG